MAGSGLSIEVTGEGEETAGAARAPDRRRPSARRTEASAPARRGGLRIRCVNRIPHGAGPRAPPRRPRSPASSPPAPCIPDGARSPTTTCWRSPHRIEGHPDNVAPCLAGGLTIAWQTAGGPRLTRLDVAPGVRPVALVPGCEARHRTRPRAAARHGPARRRRRERGPCGTARRRPDRPAGAPARRDRGPAAPVVPRARPCPSPSPWSSGSRAKGWPQ